MSKRHIECATCKTIHPDTEARSIPRWHPATASWVDGYYCAVHAPAALETARAFIAGLDLDDDERDDMTALMMLLALLRSREQMTEDLRDDEAGGAGMEHIRQQVIALLRRLDQGIRLPIVEGSALCSGCFRSLPASQIRVLPWHNASVDKYVTTFRCGECFPAAIAETRAHLEADGDREVAQLCELFGHHAVFIHEYRRGEPAAIVKPILRLTLGMVEAGTLTLPIGPTVPLAEALFQAPAAPASNLPPASTPQVPASVPPRSFWSRLFGR